MNGVKQKPIEGVSMVYSFDDANAEGARRVQYFEMFGNRAHLQGRLDRRRPARPPAVGTTSARTISTRTRGSSTTSTTTSAKTTTSPRSIPTS